MKQISLIFVVCCALIVSFADGSPGRGGFSRGGGFRSGGGSRSGGSRSSGGSSSKSTSSGSGSGSKSSGWFSGWFSSSKPSPVSSKIQPKASAPSLSAIDSGPKPIDWNLNSRNSPIGPPPAYPGLERVPVGPSANAPPLYSLNKQPPAYNSINHLNTGVSSGTHLGPPPAYTPGFGQSVPGIAAHHPPITVINTYPAHSGGSSFGSNLGTNMLFYGLGSMSSRGSSSSVHHVYHDTNTNSAGRSFVEPEQTTTATVVPLAPFPATEPVPTSTSEPLPNSSPSVFYSGNRPPVFVNPELPAPQSTETPVLNMTTLISTLAAKPDVSVIPIIEPSRHISTSFPLSATTETPDMVMNTTMRSWDVKEKLVKFALDLYFLQFLRNQTKVDLEPAIEAKKEDFGP